MEIQKEKLSPMMQQYFALKEKYPDCVLFFRLGDFYEMFFDDAIRISRELELTLTGRDCGLKERAPMCGIPYHSVDMYLKRLVERGYKIAICEQLIYVCLPGSYLTNVPYQSLSVQRLFLHPDIQLHHHE